MDRRFFLPFAAVATFLLLLSAPSDAFQSTPNRTPIDTWLASIAGFQARMAHEASEMWAEFTWGLATETLSRTTRLNDLGVPELGSFFPGDLSATILFSLGYPGFQNSKIAEVALGSLLHMVQDSFSRSHVTRADALGADCDGVPGALQPGAIRQFHSYARQNHRAHNSADDAQALELNRIETTPSVVDVCAQIIQLWSRKASWTEARKYLEYVFTLDPQALAAGPGEGYQQ
jgi:hypothetical protein